MTPSPTPSLAGAAGEPSLTALPLPTAYIWHEHLGEKTKSLRWTTPNQWEFAEKVERLYTEEQVRELLSAAIPALPPDTGKQAVRMLTPAERFEIDLKEPVRIADIEAIQRKFCEVNGLAISQPAPTPDAAPVKPETMILNYEPRNGRSFWHSDCINHFGGIVKEVKREPDRSLMECLHCNKRGYYAKGWVGSHTVSVEHAASMQDTSSPQQGGA